MQLADTLTQLTDIWHHQNACTIFLYTVQYVVYLSKCYAPYGQCSNREKHVRCISDNEKYAIISVICRILQILHYLCTETLTMNCNDMRSGKTWQKLFLNVEEIGGNRHEKISGHNFVILCRPLPWSMRRAMSRRSMVAILMSSVLDLKTIELLLSLEEGQWWDTAASKQWRVLPITVQLHHLQPLHWTAASSTLFL
jgi:hypothetical protein